MKQFSELIPSERKFEVGDEVFEWVTPYWEDLAGVFDADLQKAFEALAEAEAAEEEGGATPEVRQSRDDVQLTQQRIKLFLDESDHKRWDALCVRKEKPVPLFMYGQVWRWLLEVATGRPTEPPSESASGGGNGDRSSQVGSRSRAGSRRR